GASLADEAHDLGPPPLHAVEGGEQLIELVRPSHEGRREPEPRETTSRSRLGQRTEETMNDKRLGLAAKHYLARRLEREAGVGQDAGRLGHQNASGACCPRRRAVVFTVSPVTA